MREPVQFAQAGVLGHDAVAFTQYQVVAIRRVRSPGTEVKVRAVQESEDVDQREGASDVDRRAGICHLQNRFAQFPGLEARLGR